jgi:pyridoxal/pyridoxine/pyridoxamine kinase
VRVGILTKKDIADLKAMTRQTEIFHHILTEIHSRWEEVAAIIIATNVEIAMQKWEDHLKFMLLIGAKIASEYEGVGNIFAQVFVDHMKKIRENMTHKDWTNTVLFMQNLAKALNFLLNVFEKTLDIVIKVVANLGNFNRTVSTGFQLIKYAAIVMITYKSFQLLAKILVLSILKFRALFKLITTKGVWSFATLNAVTALWVARLFAIVAGLAAVGVAVASLWEMATSANEDADKKYEELMKKYMEAPKKLLDERKITWAEFLDYLAAAQQVAAKGAGMKNFWDVFKENIAGGLEYVGEKLQVGMSYIWSSLFKAPIYNEKEMQEAITKWKNAIDEGLKGLEGLGSIADPKVMFDEKAIEEYEESIATLEDQYKAYSQTVAALKTGELWWKDSDAIRQYQDDIIATGKIAREYAELEEEVGSARADLWKGITEQVRAANLQYDNINRNLKMMEELQDSLFELTHTTHEVQMEMLRLEVENMRKTAGITEDLKKAIDEYYKYRMIQIERDFNHMNELAERTADSMESSFSDLFFDVITRDFEDLEDLVTRVLRNVQRILSDVLAQMLRAKLIGEQLGTGAYSGGVLTDWWKKLMGGGLAGPPGGYGASTVPQHMHSGGLVGSTFGRHINVPDWFSSFAPRLHNGLKADEYPAILQAGEHVIKRGGRDEDKVNIQINNYTGEKAEVKEDRNPYGGRDITVIIGETLSRDVSQGGALHQSLRRTFGLKPVTAGR